MTFLQGEFKYFRRLLLFLQDNRLLILQLLIVKIENANNTTETATHREQRQRVYLVYLGTGDIKHSIGNHANGPGWHLTAEYTKNIQFNI